MDIEQNIGRLVYGVGRHSEQIAMDFPISARKYLEGDEINPAGLVIGAAAWGMQKMGMTDQEITAVLTKAMMEIIPGPAQE